MKALIPDVDVYEQEDLGHLPQIEDFARFKTAFSSALKN